MLGVVRVALLLAFAVSGLALLFMLRMWVGLRQKGDMLPAGFEWYLALSAVVVVASWCGRRWLLRMYQARDRRELASVQAQGRFEAGGTPWRAIALLLAGLIFGAGGAWLLGDGSLVWGACAFALGGLLAWAGLGEVATLFRHGPTLRMDAWAIDYAMFGPIAWTNVIAVQLESAAVQYQTRYTLHLCVRDPRRYLLNTPMPMRWFQSRRLRGFKEFGPLAIPLNGLDRDPRLIYGALLELRFRHDPPLLADWHPRMSAHETLMWSRVQGNALEVERIMTAIDAAQGDPELKASLQWELQPHLAKLAALSPEIRSLLAASARRARWQTLVGGLLLALAFAAVVLGIVGKVT